MAAKTQSIVEEELLKTEQFIINKNYKAAQKQLDVLIKHDPHHPKIHEYMGDIYFNQKDYKQSVWHYFSSLEKNENNIKGLLKLSENLFFLKQYQQAINIINKVIEMDSSYTYAFIILGMCEQELENEPEAITAYENAIAINPKEVLAYLNLGLLYKKNKEYDKAVKIYQQAIVHNSGNHFILSNLGNLFYLQGKFDDAILSHQRAVKAKPDSPIVYYNYANTLLHANKIEDSNKVYKKAIELDPKFARAHVNLGTNLLTFKKFKEGFKEYSWRMYFDEIVQVETKKNKKIWTGEDIKGKNLLVSSETGFGNIIQFARYLPILKQQYECNIIFSCPEEIVHLFENSDYIDQIIGSDHDFNDYAYWIPLQSLVPIISPDPSQSCPEPSLLHVNDNKLIEWETLLGVDDKIKIGLCWQGNIKNPRNHLNSIDLSLFKKILSIENTSFISLQKGHGHHQIAKNQFEKHMVDYDFLMDSGSKKFLDSTAIIKYLDLVITCDTSIAHLAGSLGTQTWLLLPKLCDWRWFQDTEETIWYDNMRLFRQEKMGDWSSVIARVHDEALTLSKNLYEIRKEQEQEIQNEPQAVSVTEDITLEQQSDDNETTTSAEDMHNESAEPEQNTPQPEEQTLEQSSAPETRSVPEPETQNQTISESSSEVPAPTNEEIVEPVVEQAEIAPQTESAEQSLDPEPTQDPPQQQSIEDDGNEIQPRVIRDDDGGDKIKFKR